MPAHAGIHDFLCRNEDKSWMPACAGMTGARIVRYPKRLSRVGLIAASPRQVTTQAMALRSGAAHADRK
jgi:hypothetical protein